MIEEGPFEGIAEYELVQEDKNESRYVNYNKLKRATLIKEANLKAKTIARIMRDLKEVENSWNFL
jgi:hypothetical protein